MIKRKIAVISIFFSIIGVGIGGIHIHSVRAEAPSIMTLEEEYVTADPEDYRYSFPENLKEPGGNYKLSAVTYQAEVYEYTAERPFYGVTGTEEMIVTDSIVYHDLKAVLLPNDRLTDDKGEMYLRRNSSLEVVEGEPERRQLETGIIYEGIPVDSEIPPMGRIEIKNSETGRNSFQEIPLASYSYQNYRWTDDFWFPITFSVYDAAMYYLGDRMVPYHNEFPALNGCEEDLLKVIGKSPENYAIKEFEWDGEPYTDEQGVMRRNAVGKGSRRIVDCHALYRGEGEMPSPSYVYRSVYERLPEDGTKFNVAYKIKAKGIYRAEEQILQDSKKAETGRLAADFLPSFAVIGGGSLLALLMIFLFFLGIYKAVKNGKGA